MVATMRSMCSWTWCYILPIFLPQIYWFTWNVFEWTVTSKGELVFIYPFAYMMILCLYHEIISPLKFCDMSSVSW